MWYHKLTSIIVHPVTTTEYLGETVHSYSGDDTEMQVIAEYVGDRSQVSERIALIDGSVYRLHLNKDQVINYKDRVTVDGETYTVLTKLSRFRRKNVVVIGHES